MSFVSVDKISFAFTPGNWIARDFSFHMSRGECVGLTGASGRGKSTVAQIIAGHIRPQSGSIHVDGDDVTGRPQRSVFLIHQEDDLFPWLTVEHQVALGLQTQDANAIKRLLELTKLEKFRKFYPHELSGGMKKRLSLARALAVKPKLLILDESFSALDFQLRAELLRELKQLWRTNETAILLISHDPRDLEAIATRELKL